MKNMLKRLFALFIAAGVSFALCAAEGDEFSPRQGRGGNRGMRRREGGSRPGMGGMHRVSPLARFKAEKEISQKFPKEYAEIEKQLAEAEKKMQELAKKAKVDLPVSFESKMRELKAKQPAAFDKLVDEQDFRKASMEMRKLAEENGIDLGMQRPRGGRKMRGENPNADAPRRRQTVNIGRLRRAYPAEMEKLDELRKTDPAAYRAGIRKLSEQMEKDAKASQK